MPRDHRRAWLSFLPPRCPYSACSAFLHPDPGFFLRWGSYHPLCRPFPVPRFRCRRCRRTFSRQSFCAHRRLHKPHLTSQVWLDFVSGVSIQQSARRLRVSRTTVEDRRDRVGRHCLRLLHNLERRAPPPPRAQMDEIETFERHRVLRPLTVGLLVDAESHYVMAFAVGRMRSRGSSSPGSRRRREVFEALHGRRPSESGKVVRSCLRRLRGGRVQLLTDRKPLYATAVAALFPGGEVEHVTISGKLPKGPANPLFVVNHAAAMARYGMSRLIRRTWCTTKDRRRLRLHGAMWSVWGNCWRWRSNGERVTPAMARGIVPRRLRMEELFG